MKIQLGQTLRLFHCAQTTMEMWQDSQRFYRSLVTYTIGNVMPRVQPRFTLRLASKISEDRHVCESNVMRQRLLKRPFF